MQMVFILVNTMGGSIKKTSYFTKNGHALPAGTHFVKTEELTMHGFPIYRTVDDQGQIRGVDDPLAWKMVRDGPWWWAMYWKDQRKSSYLNNGNSKDPTDETGGDGKGWRINSTWRIFSDSDSGNTLGKSPAPQLKVGIVSGLCNCTILSCPVSHTSCLVSRVPCRRVLCLVYSCTRVLGLVSRALRAVRAYIYVIILT